MSTGAIIGIVIAVIVVVAIAVVASTEMRRARLRRQFGPEYDRLVEKHGGNKRKADAELAERERRVRGLSLRELTPEQQASYSGDWAAVQERFVDAVPGEGRRGRHREVVLSRPERSLEVGQLLVIGHRTSRVRPRNTLAGS